MLFNEIIDKIVKESDVNPRQYSVADRVADVNKEHFYLIEYATQLGSKFPMTDGEEVEQTETLVEGDNSFDRDIKDTSIVRVEYKPTGSSRYRCLDHDQKRCNNCYCLGDMLFTANEKKIMLKDAHPGDLLITYDRPLIVPFTEADYDAGDVEVEWIPETFHPLLWLKPAMIAAGYYKPDRYQALKDQYGELFVLFHDHYDRHSSIDLSFETNEDRGEHRR